MQDPANNLEIQPLSADDGEGGAGAGETATSKEEEERRIQSIIDKMTELKKQAHESALAYSNALNENNSTAQERQIARDDARYLLTMGGRRRSSSARKSSSRRGRRSAKKRGTQRKQKRRQRRGSRRAY